MSTADLFEIKRSLAVLFQHGDTFELRALGDRITNGYFRDQEKCAQAAVRLNQQQNVFVCLNPVIPELYARRADEIGVCKKGEGGKDHDILCRRWLLIDVDPVRAQGISATDVEKRTAEQLARQVYDYVGQQLGSACIVCVDSGNGAHLWIRLADVPNEHETAWICERFLSHLADRFNNGRAKIDKGVSNASRISALPGCVKRKGSDVADRPHRLSRLLYVPPDLQPAEWSKIVAITGAFPHDPRQPQQQAVQQSAQAGSTNTWDISQLLDQRGIEYEQDDKYVTSSGERAKRWVLSVCPFNTAHNDRSACIVKWANGAVAFKCHHDGCAGKGWADLKAAWQLPASAGITAADIVLPASQPQILLPQPATAIVRPELLIIPSLAVQPENVEWIWQNRFVLGGINLCAGRGGIGKTYFLCDLVARITNNRLVAPNGQPLRHGRVLYATGEDHVAKIIEPRMRQHAVDRSRLEYIRGLPDGQYVQLLDVIAHVDLLRDAIRLRPDTVAIVLDPISSFQGMADSNKVSHVRRFTAVLTQLAEEFNIAVLGVHHFNKGKREIAGDAISGSHAYRDAARSAWLFGLDSADPGRRLMVCDKHNWASERPLGLAYSITDGLLVYEQQPLDMTADELVAQTVQNSVDIACAWLLEQLVSGPRATVDIQIGATAEGIKERTVRRAKDRLGVVAYRESDRWYWRLPPQGDQQ